MRDTYHQSVGNPLQIARLPVVLTMRKPFDVLAEGLVSEKSRGDKTPLYLTRP